MHCQGQLDDLGSVGTLRWVSTAMLAGFPRTQPLCWRLPHPAHVSATLAARLCLPHFSPGWRTFFEEPAMLLGVVLIGRALEERAKLQASADMAALQVGSWGGVGGNGIGGLQVAAHCYLTSKGPAQLSAEAEARVQAEQQQ